MRHITPEKLLELGHTKLFELTSLRYKQNPYDRVEDFMITTITNLFTWSETEEDHYFWGHVNQGNFEAAFKLFPEYEGTHVVMAGGYLTSQNGLFKK